MRLLLIDEPGMPGERLARALAAHGHAVVSAAWEAGGAAARAEDVDACLLLSARSGQEIVAAGWFSLPMPTVLLARSIEPSEIALCLDAGAADVISSPVQLLEILARLRLLERRPVGAAGEMVAAGELRLAPDRRRAWRGERELRLSAREFDLLHAFMRQPGRVLSRRYLLDSVWDATDVGSNVVDQGVGHLRRKIDRPFGRHDLKTVRGFGYRLDA